MADDKKAIQGPPAYSNWQAALAGEAFLGAYEVTLYTDAHIIGAITDGYGPYRFLNAVPHPPDESRVKPSIILRVDNYLEYKLPSWEGTNEDFYHGGWLADEIAALASLCLGARVKPGGITREFRVDGDPLGEPRAGSAHEQPVLLRRAFGPVLPNAAGQRHLDDLAPLKSLPSLTPNGAIALIRSARLYQDALWVSEAEPHLAWLLLVSAAETAAQYWRKTDEAPLERLLAWRPELQTVLVEQCGAAVAQQVAEIVGPVTGSTKKFIDFTLTFLPDPPPRRGADWAQHRWTRSALKRSLTKIYDYRSRALHVGVPFPAPLGLPPHRFSPESWAEIPVGSGANMLGSTWLVKDLPMLLHLFEHIVRGALLKWWVSMTSGNQEGGNVMTDMPATPTARRLTGDDEREATG